MVGKILLEQCDSRIYEGNLIMKRKKLVVISHTEHYKDTDGVIKGWGSTVNEINYLADYWEEVIHVACLHKVDVTPLSSLPYTKSNIKFVPIPPYGGKSIIAKIGILFRIPNIVKQVVISQRGASEVQLRLPTSMGLFLLPLFSFFFRRNYTLWVKYAGDWSQKNPPLAYRLQRRWLLTNIAKCAVTVNGFWLLQPKHIYSFENPCLDHLDIEKGQLKAAVKSFTGKFIFSFVGRLEDAKGVHRIIEALKTIPEDTIDHVHFIGDGPKKDFYKKVASFLGSKVTFHGFLSKNQTHEILSKSHFFLLPSESEGFPKVIAEAACYGALPVVSNVGSIGHYVNETNGFVWKKEGISSFEAVLQQAVQLERSQLQERSTALLEVAKLFTFENYKSKLDGMLSESLFT